MTPDQQFVLALVAQFVALVVGMVAVWQKVQSVHVSVNSRMDQLLASTAASSRAAGVTEGKEMPATIGDGHLRTELDTLRAHVAATEAALAAARRQPSS